MDEHISMCGIKLSPLKSSPPGLVCEISGINYNVHVPNKIVAINIDDRTIVSEAEWFKNGLCHRDDDLPARIWFNTHRGVNIAEGSVNTEMWFRDGLRHRDDDKPAVINYGDNDRIVRECWYRNGKEHRDNDRPAVIICEPDGTACNIWYENGHLRKERYYKYGQEFKSLLELRRYENQIVE